jgi:iron complex outermembrane receptor protein
VSQFDWGISVKKLLLLCSTAVVMPTAAFAQSTGSVDFEKETIVVTGTRTQDVGGIQAPDAPKAKAVITQEMISRSGPGQTVLDTINLVPGVSFQNNDAYGNAGGTLSVRGFDSTRVSYTLDGIQLNDSGNYNIYSNFSIDPELIEQVNVSLGSTDVDSPTASAVGGTINQRTRIPGKEFGGRISASLGQFDYRRFFGMVDTGELTSWGTRAFVSASTSKYDNPYNNYGKLDRQQYNAKIYQPLGNNGDFISVAGRYNQDRNNFFGSLALNQNFPDKKSERKYNINVPCETDTPQAGIRDLSNSCGTEFDRRYNPSNSVNIRGNSRFTLADGIILTIDPSYQYTKANGGGTVRAEEGTFNIAGVPYTGSFITSPTGTSATPYFGRDLNGDGDTLDQVIAMNPSQTQTRRYAVIAGLRWQISDNHLVRVSTTYDHAFHRQTGEMGLLKANGEPIDVFPVNDPLVSGTTLTASDTAGVPLEKRDRKSQAILKQIAAEYVGSFMEDRLTLNAGVRAPFFTRKLDQRCFTINTGSNAITCFGDDTDAAEAYAAAFPYVVDPVTGERISGYSPPQKRDLKYNKLLPNIGVVYDFTPQISGFASYSKGLSVPSTDNLYSAFFFPVDTPEAKPKPEVTNSFDAGLRYRSSKIQAQAAVWKTFFNNRIAESFDPELNASVFRNLGKVEKWGVDGSVAYSPIKQLTVYAFGSWMQSKIKDNIQIAGPTTFDCDDADVSTAAARAIATRNCAFTAGNRESGSPKYTFGFSGSGTLGPVDLGITAKRTGPRFIYDTNRPVFSGDVDNEAGIIEQHGATAAAYWLVNLDARFNLGYFRPDLDKTFIQLNVYNLFDKTFAGGFGGGLNQSVNANTGVYGFAPNVQIGAPRTVSVTFNVGW